MAADDLHGLWAVRGGRVYRSALALLKGNLNTEQQQRLVLSMFGLWVLMGIGFIASTLHRSPMRAFNSLNRVGASSLSNEIASGAIFFAVGGLGWLLAAVKSCRQGYARCGSSSPWYWALSSSG